MIWLYVFAGSFVLGSVPFGYLVAMCRGVDVRQVGSGNIGATNVHRALGAGPGLLVFVLDFLKGAVPPWIALAAIPTGGKPEIVVMAAYAGLAAILGHCFSPFLGFRGGKGVATGLGAVAGVSPVAAVASFAIFVLLLIVTRYVSLASLVAVAALPLVALALGQAALLVPFGLLALLIFSRHTGNIKRLAAGTERKFGSRAEAVDDPAKGGAAP